jgi:thymidylate kinase
MGSAAPGNVARFLDDAVKTTWIALAGCDGAGKTTQVGLLAASLRARRCVVEVVDKRDILRPERAPACRFIRPDLDDLNACVASMNATARALFWFWAVGVTLGDLTRDDGTDRVVVADGYWMKQAAAEVERGADEGWVLGLVSAFPRPDLTLYLDVEPHVALARKAERTIHERGGRAEGGAHAFVEHQRRVRARLLAWRERFGWEKVDAGAPIEVVREAIDARVSALFSHVR